MKAVVFGGRHFAAFVDGKSPNKTLWEALTLERFLDQVHEIMPITELAHGVAKGADTAAERWAEFNEIPVTRFRADWARLGTRAGPIRNQKMLDEFKPEMAIAFPGGRGTQDMLKRCRVAQLAYIFDVTVEYPEWAE